MVAGMCNQTGDVLLLAVDFFFPPTLYFSIASNGIVPETASVPLITHMDVTAVNKDFVRWYLQFPEPCGPVENSQG